ncbi:Methyltransferase domain-containing protein [Bradyrhizobium sp. NFR13]|uniref:DUF4942 domain-containing protein n=1 Tax=Bradyrhizobium sp. NFR13 TaxID=1566285 RepID=UPI0008E3FEEB|nr:DUF4942 domain-containing protein [Bradyrhizobium sp. NFR13]SFL99856.1 Methyltransferase domain-containing protein [Bradyrhizobium sp. NFR13]
MNKHVPTLQRSLSDVVAEYDTKKAALKASVQAFEDAGNEVKMAATVGGTYGRQQINVGHVWESTLESNLLTSAWLHIYGGLNIDVIASPTDKKLFEQAMASPPPFTIDNIRGTFGKYILDPRGNILRGLAEVFCGLDQAFKSHDKVKIGVAGLPKRVVMRGFGGWDSYGKNQIQAMLNALAAYQGRPLTTYDELEKLVLHGYSATRGVQLKTFKNGNGHLHFESGTLNDINKALAEYYGDVLPDTTDEKPTKKAESTAVSKDLQYYPTPEATVERVLSDIYGLAGKRVLEPSCGDGRFMDALRKAKAKPYGIEVDVSRAALCRAKGHNVLTANFLETVPTRDFDFVVMNPPFYGKHYAKHVRHAFDFLKPEGTLVAILPVTARYDHGLLEDLGSHSRYDGPWSDLPVGSFSESGTNINTTVFKVRAPALPPQQPGGGA